MPSDDFSLILQRDRRRFMEATAEAKDRV